MSSLIKKKKMSLGILLVLSALILLGVSADEEINNSEIHVQEVIHDEIQEDHFETTSSGTWVQVATGRFEIEGSASWSRSFIYDYNYKDDNKGDNNNWNDYEEIYRSRSNTYISKKDHRDRDQHSAHIAWGWEFNGMGNWEDFNQRIRYKISPDSGSTIIDDYYYISARDRTHTYTIGFGFGAYSARDSNRIDDTSTDALFIAGCDLRLSSPDRRDARPRWDAALDNCDPIRIRNLGSDKEPNVWVTNYEISLDKNFRLYNAVFEIEAQCTSGQCCNNYRFRPQNTVVSSSYVCQGNSIEKHESYCTGSSGTPQQRIEIIDTCTGVCNFCESGKSTCQAVAEGTTCGDHSTCSADGACVCFDVVWDIDPSNVCTGETVTQTSNCGNTRVVEGTKCCDTSWTPDASNICMQESVHQTSNCGTERVIPGNLFCPYAPKNILITLQSLPIFQYTDFYTSVQTIDITGALQTAMQTCSTDNQGYCTIPVTIEAQGYGDVSLSNLQIIREEAEPCENCECVPVWYCGDWGECMGDKSLRACRDLNNCGDTSTKPITEQQCEATCHPDWHCEEWDTCTNGVTTRTCVDRNYCSNTIPPQTQAECTVPETEEPIYTVQLEPGWNLITVIQDRGRLVQLRPGWNEFGYSYHLPTNIHSNLFITGGVPRNFNTARDEGIIQGNVYSNIGEQKELPLDGEYFTPGYGYRIYVTSPTTIVFAGSVPEKQVAWDNLVVTNLDNPSASRDQTIMSYAYRFDALQNKFVYLPEDETHLRPRHAYWIYAFNRAEISFE